MFGHLAPSRWCCLGRLSNPLEAEPHWRKWVTGGCLTLWRWYRNCNVDSGSVPWGVHGRKPNRWTGGWRSETGDGCCRQQGWRAMANDTLWNRGGSIMSLRCQTRSCRIWCLPYEVLVLLWSDLSFLCPCFSLFTQEYLFYANVYRKCAVCSLILQGSQLRDCSAWRDFGLLGSVKIVKYHGDLWS